MAALVSEVTMPDWTSVLVAFGVVDSNKHFSTSGCLTQMLMLNHSRLHIGNMSRRNSSRYGERVWEVEILILSSDMGAAASSVYKRLASLISDKRCQQYSITIG